MICKISSHSVGWFFTFLMILFEAIFENFQVVQLLYFFLSDLYIWFSHIFCQYTFDFSLNKTTSLQYKFLQREEKHDPVLFSSTAMIFLTDGLQKFPQSSFCLCALPLHPAPTPRARTPGNLFISQDHLCAWVSHFYLGPPASSHLTKYRSD